VITALEDVFSMISAQDSPNGTPRYAPDNQEIFENWETKISGDVENTYTLKLTDILDEEIIIYPLTHRCVIENSGLIGTFSFSGISLAAVIEKAFLKEGANQLSIVADRGYESAGPFTYPLANVMESEKSMLAIRVNGEPLPAELGYPVICILESAPDSHNQHLVTEPVIQTVEEPFSTYGYLDYGVEDPDILNCPGCGVVNVYDGQIFEYGEAITFEGYADGYMDQITCVKFSWTMARLGQNMIFLMQTMIAGYTSGIRRKHCR